MKTTSFIHSKETNQDYLINQNGVLPVVIFGRTIKENSLYGNMYYFNDNKIRVYAHNNIFSDENNKTGYIEVQIEELRGPIIFTVPENMEFSRLNDPEYAKQFAKNAIYLNANTTSPNYIIRNGEIICVKKIQYVFTNQTQSHNNCKNIKLLGNELTLKYRIQYSKWYTIFHREDGGNGISESSWRTGARKHNIITKKCFHADMIDKTQLEGEHGCGKSSMGGRNTYIIHPVGRYKNKLSIFSIKVHRFMRGGGYLPSN